MLHLVIAEFPNLGSGSIQLVVNKYSLDKLYELYSLYYLNIIITLIKHLEYVRHCAKIT